MATLARLDVLLGLNAAAFSRGINRAQYKARKFGREMERVGRGLTTSLTVPLAAVGAAASKLSLDFDNSLSQIVGLVGVAEDQVAAWRGELLKLGPAIGKSPQELADALFFITSAGIQGENALKALEASARASAAGLGETAVVADAITSAINAYGAANMDAAQATSILVATVREGKAAADTLAPVIGRVLPVAAELGVTFDQVGASLAAMTRLGLGADEAATSLRATLSTILKPAEGARKALAEMGTPVEALRASLANEGLLATLFKLREALDQNETEITEIFPNIRALTGVLNLTGASADNARGIFERLSKTTTEDLKKAFDAIPVATLTFNKAIATVKASLISLGTSILPLVLPVVQGLVAGIQQLGQAFDELSPRSKAITIAVAAFVAAIGPTLVILGGIVFALGSLSTAIVGTVAGLGAAALLLIANWDKVKAAVAAFVEFVTPALNAVGKLAAELWTEAAATAREVWPAIKKIVAEAVAVVRALWAEWGDELVTTARAVWMVFRTIVKSTVQAVLGALEALVKFLAGDLEGAQVTLYTASRKVWDGIGRVVRAAVYNMQGALAGAAAFVLQKIGTMLERLRALAAAWAAMPWATPGRAAAEAALGPIDDALAGIGTKVSALEAEQNAWTIAARQVLQPLTETREKLVQMQSDWVEVGGAADKAIGQNLITFTRAAGDASRTLRGGFGKAVESAFVDAGAKYNKMAADIEARPVRITFDVDDLDRKLRDRGLSPSTAGALPGA